MGPPVKEESSSVAFVLKEKVRGSGAWDRSGDRGSGDEKRGSGDAGIKSQCWLEAVEVGDGRRRRRRDVRE